MKALIAITLSAVLLLSCIYPVFQKDVVVAPEYQKALSQALSNRSNGWFGPAVSITNKMAAQGFYGTALALDWRKTHSEKTFYAINEWIYGTTVMLEDTVGVYLQDNNPSSFTNWVGGNSKWEANADQMFSLLVGVYMVHKFVSSESSMVDNTCHAIVIPVDAMLRSHGYTLWNFKTKKAYDNGFMIGYYTETEAIMKDILGDCFRFPVIDTRKFLGWNVGGTNDSLFLKYLVMGTQSKDEAVKIIATLDNQQYTQMKNLNFAALYVYLVRKWQITASNFDFYSGIVGTDTDTGMWFVMRRNLATF